MFNKIKFYIIGIIIFIVFGGTIFWLNFIDKGKTCTLVDVEDKKEYSISLKQNSVIINNIEYYVNINQLSDNINKAKNINTNNSITSSIIVKDDMYNKYDIIINDNKTYIIFYKFVDEYDDTFDSPMFNLDEFEKIFKNLTK